MEMPDWVSVLMAHLLRHEESIQGFEDSISPEDLQRVHGFTSSLLWTISRDYYKKYKKVIPRSSLESQLVDYNAHTWMLEVSSEEVCDFIVWVYSVPAADLNFEEATDHARRLLGMTRVQHRVQEAAMDGSMSITEIATMVNEGVEQASIGYVDVIDPLANVASLLGAAPADPVGGAEVQYFNQLCQGGLRRGEVAILLGPTGGFKTTMALDVCCAMANTHEHSMYITYEQALSAGDIPLRILARMADISKVRCESVTFDQLTPEEQARIQDAQTRSHYMQLVDRTQHCDHVSDVGGLISVQARAGKKPRLVVIDQLLQWLEPWPEYTVETQRRLTQDVVNKVKHDIAEKHGVAVVILHQLNAAFVGGSSTKKPHHSEGSECKSVCFWADFGIAMGNLNKEKNVFWAVASKTRRGKPTDLLIQPDGDKCHLKLCNDYEVSSSGDFVRKGGAANMVTPAMSGRSGPTAISKGDV